MADGIEAVCHCGAVRLSVPEAPTSVTSCNCTLCHAYGALWAYYSDADVCLPAAELTQRYSHGDKMIAFHRCSNCGCTTHWVGLDAAGGATERSSNAGRMAINARLLPRAVLQGASVRALDGLESWRVMDEDFTWAYCPTQSRITTREVNPNPGL